jgi:hypothetical protein
VAGDPGGGAGPAATVAAVVLNRGHGVVAALAAAAAQLRDMLCRCSGLKPGWLEYAVTAVTAVTL